MKNNQSLTLADIRSMETAGKSTQIWEILSSVFPLVSLLTTLDINLYLPENMHFDWQVFDFACDERVQDINFRRIYGLWIGYKENEATHFFDEPLEESIDFSMTAEGAIRKWLDTFLELSLAGGLI